MSFFVKRAGKYALYKVFGADTFSIGGLEEDPYVEVIPDDELKFWQARGSKRTRGVPSGIPPDKREPLAEIQKLAYKMDACFSRIGIRVGLGGLIGIIPGVGTIIVLILNLYILWLTIHVDDFPLALIGHMIYNLVLDFVLGMIPIVGDIFSVGYRANTRNFKLARDFMIIKYSGSSVPQTGSIKVKPA